jgi:hypothetical protein
VVEPRQALAVGVRASVALLVAGGLAYTIWTNRSGATELDWAESWGSFAAAAGLFAVAPLVQGATFVLALRSLGADAPELVSMSIWTRSFLYRYAPSGALGYLYRIRRESRLGAERTVVLKATGLEQLSVLLAGGAVAGAAFLGGLAALPIRRVAAMTALNAAAWVPTGLAVWLLANELSGADLGFRWLLGAYACSWLVGFLVPLAPGGLGLREGTLAVFLADPLAGGAAVSIALAVRLASTAGELIAVGAVEAASLRR